MSVNHSVSKTYSMHACFYERLFTPFLVYFLCFLSEDIGKYDLLTMYISLKGRKLQKVPQQHGPQFPRQRRSTEMRRE